MFATSSKAVMRGETASENVVPPSPMDAIFWSTLSRVSPIESACIPPIGASVGTPTVAPAPAPVFWRGRADNPSRISVLYTLATSASGCENYERPNI